MGCLYAVLALFLAIIFGYALAYAAAFICVPIFGMASNITQGAAAYSLLLIGPGLGIYSTIWIRRKNIQWEKGKIHERTQAREHENIEAAAKVRKAATERTNFDYVRRPFEQVVSDIPNLFWFVTNHGSTAQKGKFETEEEFSARFPKPFDITTVFYIPITDLRYSGIEYSTKTERLTAIGPSVRSVGDSGRVTQFEVFRKMREYGSYTRHNSFGIAVDVENRDWHSYNLLLHTPVLPTGFVSEDHLKLSAPVERKLCPRK